MGQVCTFTRGQVGPRTERGKTRTRFNAVKYGLFADHIVIPIVDDADPEQFDGLLANLMNDFKPEGAAECFYVSEMAHSTWKLRRARICEQGSILMAAWWTNRIRTSRFNIMRRDIERLGGLRDAKQELEATGSLSPNSHGQVIEALRLSKTEERWRLEEDNTPPEQGVALSAPDSGERLRNELTQGIKTQLMIIDKQMEIVEGMNQDYIAAHALPERKDLDQVLRYAKAAEKRFDWALQKLLESQERRRGTEHAESFDRHEETSAKEILLVGDDMGA